MSRCCNFCGVELIVEDISTYLLVWLGTCMYIVIFFSSRGLYSDIVFWVKVQTNKKLAMAIIVEHLSIVGTSISNLLFTYT